MNRIIVDVGISENRLAFLEDKELVELYVERRNDKRIVGNIYKGRVTNVLPGMQAAFIDIGLEKNCFLYVKDALNREFFEENEDKSKNKNLSIKDVVKQGQDIVVQVVKEPIDTKGARVTTNITLPGRYLVLMPQTTYVGVSRRIKNSEERKRLKEEIQELKPENMGAIIRTVARGKNKEDFKEDIKFLLKLWQKIERDKKMGFAPRLIYKDFDLINKTIRDSFNQGIDEFIVNDPEEYKHVVEFVELLSPLLKDRISLFDEPIGIFDYYKINSQINSALGRKIWLKSGGYIIIDNTEALTVIDVNTGKYVGTTNLLDDTVYKTNIEAAVEIAKQLKLRNIGGIIIIDFIDMIDKQYAKDVLSTLEEALNKDHTKTKVLGITSLGLVEMTRKKVRQRMESVILRECHCCEGRGMILNEYTLLYKLEKEIIRISRHTNCQAVIFEVHPSVLKIFDKEKNIINEIERKANLKTYILPNKLLHYNDLVTKAMGNMEAVKKLID